MWDVRAEIQILVWHWLLRHGAVNDLVLSLTASQTVPPLTVFSVPLCEESVWLSR